MTKGSRILTYGGACLAIVAGVACAAAIGGDTGSVLADLLVGLGLVAIVGLLFLEVGLSEDRDRERERRARARARRTDREEGADRTGAGGERSERGDRGSGRRGPVTRIARLRGERRRLR